MPSSVIEQIRKAAQANPAATAMIFDGKLITYAQLLSLLAATARLLHAQGVKAGDAVGLTLPNTPVHLIALLALARLGACSIPLHDRFSSVTRTRLVEKFSIRVIVGGSAEAGVKGIPLIVLNTLSASGSEADALPFDAALEPATPFRVLLTSGTTGEPKGVLLTHGQVLARLEQAVEGWSPRTRLLVPDIHLSIGFFWPLMALCRGGSLVFTRSTELGEQVLAVQLHAVTHIVFSPWSAQQLVDALPAESAGLPSLEHLRLVGGAASAKLLHSLSQRVTPHIYSPYALTELATLTVLSPEDLLADPSSAGRLRPGARAEIVGPDDQPLPPGTRGQIRLATTSMPRNYYRDDEHTRQKFRQGWFYTGDTGYLSADGMLHVEGRVDDILNIGGHKVTPQYIEDTLMQHPEVKEAVALLLESASSEPQLVAAVIPRQPRVSADLRAYCQGKLGPMTPEKFFFMKEFPRNPSGKVLRADLARLVHEHALAAVKTQRA